GVVWIAWRSRSPPPRPTNISPPAPAPKLLSLFSRCNIASCCLRCVWRDTRRIVRCPLWLCGYGQPQAICSADQAAMQLIDSLLISEEDALECCHWLRQAGFPQYAKQYQECFG
ncbi:hypothetical protein ANCDUO_16128, partial [Ancylostoma duodenale]